MCCGWYYRRKGGSSLMNDLAVLTPPFLVAAAVITAIVAFLRHEMGRKRVDRADLEEDFPAPGPEADDAADGKSAGDTHRASASARDPQL
jgi:hypothetical protein